MLRRLYRGKTKKYLKTIDKIQNMLYNINIINNKGDF